VAIDSEITDRAKEVRDSWLVPQPPATVALLPWTGFKRNDPARFFQPLCDIVRLHQGPICLTTTSNNNLDYGGWFNYFFAEAKSIANRDTEIELNFGRVFSLMFDLQVQGGGASATISFAGNFPLPLSAAFNNMLTTAPGGIPKSILTYLFELGFEEADTTTAGDYFARGLALKSNMPDAVSVRSSKGEFVFGYRGDTRDVPTVVAQQGAKCRADLDFWRRDAHVTAAWHPWNNAVEDWKKMWYRKGAKDNDYFTLNSMAQHFHISCAYPMFRSFEINQGLLGPVSGWTPLQRAMLTPRKVSVVTVYDRKASQWIEVLRDETRVFACAIASTTTIAKTYELNNYPESAVRNVSLEDMLAWIKVRRYHHPPASAQEHYDSTRTDPSMTVKVLSWGWVRSEDETRASLGCTVDGMKVLSAKLQNLMGKVFDISHTSYKGEASYDVDRIQSATPPPQPVAKPVRLSGR
jgi:hypothetical protein